MDWLETLDRRCLALTRRIALLAVLGMLVLSILTTADVLLRYLFSAPIQGLYEISALIVAVMITASFPAGLAQRNNLTIDFLRGPLGPSADAALGAIGAFLILVFMAIICWRFALHAVTLGARNEITMIIQWPVAPFWWAATFFIGLCVPIQLLSFVIQLRHARSIAASPDSRARRIPAAASVAAMIAATAVIYWYMTVMAGEEAMGALVGFGFLAMWLPILFLIPIGPAMGFAGLVGAALVVEWEPALSTLAIRSTAFLSNLDLAVLPLFLMMGSFASAAGLSEDAYRLAQALFGHRLGGLAVATIGGCAGFGAVTGSSLATAATIGRVALPQMRARGYSAALATGSVAAGGTLGALIPPSGMMVIYAVLTESSVGKMFIAAIVPAAIAVALYMITIAIYVRVSPASAPAAPPPSAREVRLAFRGSWGVFVLFGVVIGGLYGGVFTATEAAAVGAGGAFLFALGRGKLKGDAFGQVLAEVAANTAMIYLLLFGAVIFAFFVGISEVPSALVSYVEGLDVAPLVVIFLLVLVYLALGCVMDPITSLLITVPVAVPLVLGLGYDRVWWGIVTVVVIEIGLITPPIGMNVFVIKTVARDVPITTVFRGIMPFLAADLIKVAVLVLFPALVLWLPNSM